MQTKSEIFTDRDNLDTNLDTSRILEEINASTYKLKEALDEQDLLVKLERAFVIFLDLVDTLGGPEKLKTIYIHPELNESLTEFLSLLYSVNETLCTEENRIDPLTQEETSNPRSRFYRINKLVDHDIVKPFAALRGYLPFLADLMCIPSDQEEKTVYLQEVCDYIVTIFNNVEEGFSRLMALKAYRIGDKGSFNLYNYPQALGFSRLSINEYYNDTYKCSLEIKSNTEIETAEILFCISTLILNALSAGATQIKVRVFRGKDGLVVSVLDNASGDFFPREYILNMEERFKTGMQKPLSSLDQSSGGGKMVAQLAGQRYALQNPLEVPRYSEDQLKIYYLKDGFKGIRFQFADYTNLPLELLAERYYLRVIDSFKDVDSKDSVELARTFSSYWLELLSTEMGIASILSASYIDSWFAINQDSAQRVLELSLNMVNRLWNTSPVNALELFKTILELIREMLETNVSEERLTQILSHVTSFEQLLIPEVTEEDTEPVSAITEDMVSDEDTRDAIPIVTAEVYS